MQDPKEIAKINEFLSVAAPYVISRVVKMAIRSLNVEVAEKGAGADLAFVIKSGTAEIEFLPYNMMLDIATIDRKASTLKFDENVWQLDFFLAKTAHALETRLRIINQVLDVDNADEAVARIRQSIKSDEWARIWKFDPRPPAATSVGTCKAGYKSVQESK